MEGLHARPIEQPEELVHLPSDSAIRTGAVGGLAVAGAEMMKLSTVDQDETSDVLVALRAWTRQYQVPTPRFGVQLVALIQPDDAVMVEKDELELTCAEYWMVPLEMVEAFHASVVAQDPEQVLSASAIGTGVVGVDEEPEDERVKLPTVDHADTLVVATASRAWTRQYQVPFVNVRV